MALTEQQKIALNEELQVLDRQIGNLRERQRRLYAIRNGDYETEGEQTAQRAKVETLAAEYKEIKPVVAIADAAVVASK